MLKYNTFILFFLMFVNAVASDEILIPFFKEVNGEILWGYVNRSGEERIKPSFQRCDVFREGLAAVMIQERWGYIDLTGTIIVSPTYTDAGPFSEGMAYVRAAPSPAEQKFPFSEGNQLYGFINTSGKVVIDFLFERARIFSEGLAYVEMQTTGGYINHNGDLQIETNILGGDFLNGLAPVYGLVEYTPVKLRRVGGDVEKCYIDHTGERKLRNGYKDVSAFNQGKALVSKSFTNDVGVVNIKYAFIDVRGRVIDSWHERPELPDIYVGAPDSFTFIDDISAIPLKNGIASSSLWVEILAICRNDFGTHVSESKSSVLSCRTARIYNSTGVYRDDYRVGLHLSIIGRTLRLRTEAEFIDGKGCVHCGHDLVFLKIIERRILTIIDGLPKLETKGSDREDLDSL